MCLDKGIKDDGCTFKKANQTVVIGVCHNKLFSKVLKTRSVQEAEQANISVNNLMSLQWRGSLSHQNIQYVRKNLEHMLIPITETKDEFSFKACKE